MSPRGELTLVEGYGIRDDADAGRASRQVTVLSEERSVAAQRALGAAVDPAARTPSC